MTLQPKYVGTPAVGTSKAAPAAGVATVGPKDDQVNNRRRRLVWCAVTGFLGAWFIAFLRFFLPRTLFEPPTVFKIGYPGDYGLGIDTKWQQKYRIWVVRDPDRLFVIYARCTHLGCTPDWKSSENKFKCPCHGSGYDNEGVNFEAPRRVPWTVLMSSRGLTAKSLSIPRASISGPRASRATSMTREPF